MTLLGMFSGIAVPLLNPLSPAHAAEAKAGGAKVLIVYYSRSGNTRDMAKQIQEKVGGDIVELQTVQPYPSEYKATTEQAKRELESNYFPPLSTKIENIGAYDVVFVGSPNWWSTMAMPVRTFLSENNLSEKTVVPFITHEGSGLGRSVADLKSFCPNATILEGLAVRGSRVNSSQDERTKWLNKLSITK